MVACAFGCGGFVLRERPEPGDGDMEGSSLRKTDDVGPCDCPGLRGKDGPGPRRGREDEGDCRVGQDLGELSQIL